MIGMDYTKIFSALKSDGAQFVYGIFKSWYLLAALPAIAVTYNVLDGMTKSGTLDKIYKEVDETLKMIQDISEVCPRFIEDLDKFFDCIEDPDAYRKVLSTDISIDFLSITDNLSLLLNYINL